MQHGRDVVACTHDVADLELLGHLDVDDTHTLCGRLEVIERVEVLTRHDAVAFAVLIPACFQNRTDLGAPLFQLRRSDLKFEILFFAPPVEVNWDFFGRDPPALRNRQAQYTL